MYAARGGNSCQVVHAIHSNRILRPIQPIWRFFNEPVHHTRRQHLAQMNKLNTLKTGSFHELVNCGAIDLITS